MKTKRAKREMAQARARAKALLEPRPKLYASRLTPIGDNSAKPPRKPATLTGILPGEEILADDYLVNWDYLYVVDGNVRRSDIKGTVWELKHNLRAKEIRNCRMVERGLS